jgi:hypothetical protein
MFGRSRRVDNHDGLGFIGRGLDETTVGQRRHDLCPDLLVAYWRVDEFPSRMKNVTYPDGALPGVPSGRRLMLCAQPNVARAAMPPARKSAVLIMRYRDT